MGRDRESRGWAVARGAVAVVAVTAAAGCLGWSGSAGQPALEPIPGPSIPPPAASSAAIDWVEYHDSLADLAAAADIVVLARPTGAREMVDLPQEEPIVLAGGTDGVLAVSTYAMVVHDVLAGTGVDAGDTIMVTEWNTTDRSGQSVLRNDTWFVLFLDRYVRGPGPEQDTGSWVVIGGPMGIYLDLERAGSTFTALDAQIAPLPAEAALAELAEQVRTGRDRNPHSQPSVAAITSITGIVSSVVASPASRANA